MIKAIWTYLQYGNRFCGLEHTTVNGNDIIYGTLLRQSKKELNIDSCFEVNTINNISEKLSKNQFATLVINNDKVLFKAIESEQQDALKLVYKAFPNIDLSDFYFEILSQEHIHFVSLCRKDYVNNLVDAYCKLKFLIIDVHLGNNLIGDLSNFINETDIYSSNAKIEIHKNHITQIKKSGVVSEKYNINGLTVSNQYLLSFAGALNTVLKNSVLANNFSSERGRLLDSYKQTRFFNQFLKIGGLLILGLLLINFFFFNHYFDKVNELKQISEVNQTTKTQIVKLNGVVSKKQKMVDDLLKSNGSKSSMYSNTIIHSLPNTILLSEFNYQPVLKRIKENKAIELEQNSISVSGSSNDSGEFSNWIASLEQENWINKVEIMDYGTTTTSASDFEIKITLTDE
jgi:Tfp pilus assembly protein PilN